MEQEYWAEALGVSEPGESGVGGGVKYVFIINFPLLFLVFHSGGGVGGEFAISQ